ncbi:hypothetical protein WOLCODRAFT_139692 [Wolfiporia cocos MD-104 SS10]|uniref:DUF6699 domain-containing protein n=1 Tax=Wolfiporia cocos (strain MD-104) TaxID=742152 RepID=A0A2H3JG95_WOLCO|nr:hypothetical protein WOLCODRAFT_139692 [Wolfiporia cocos MD-104 SS10]
MLYDCDNAHDQDLVLRGSRGVPRALLAEPATMPPTRTLTLRIVHHAYPWTIVISAGRHATVTVGDVLQAIYDHLRTPTTQHGLHISVPAHLHSDINVAFSSRCLQIAGPAAHAEMSRGILRIDYLRGATYFGGIAPLHDQTSHDGVVLELKVSRR